jgi:signal transduction histidine kinase
MFAEAARGNEEPARDLVRSALQPRQEALSAQIARLLVASNEEEQRAAGQMEEIYSGLERNTYIFLALSLAAIATISALLIRANRRVFARMEHLSKARSEIAESAFRAISRDLHDEFGQILTALGAMLRRAGRDAPPSFTGELSETQQAVQDALDKVRGLSQSLHPVILEEQGLDAAIRWHVAAFERQTGIRVSYSNEGAVEAADPHRAIHFFRVLQEALNNVAKHAGVSEARVHCAMRDDRLTLEVEDAGVGFSSGRKNGIGLAAMRERAGILDGTIQISRREGGGTRVLLEAPR